MRLNFFFSGVSSDWLVEWFRSFTDCIAQCFQTIFFSTKISLIYACPDISFLLFYKFYFQLLYILQCHWPVFGDKGSLETWLYSSLIWSCPRYCQWYWVALPMTVDDNDKHNKKDKYSDKDKDKKTKTKTQTKILPCLRYCQRYWVALSMTVYDKCQRQRQKDKYSDKDTNIDFTLPQKLPEILSLTTGWSKETVDCNLSLTDVKDTKYSITQ